MLRRCMGKADHSPAAERSSAAIGRSMEELKSELHRAAARLSWCAGNAPLLTATNQSAQLNLVLMLMSGH